MVLWARYLCTMREVHDVLHLGDFGGYTAALNMLHIEQRKGLMVRDNLQR